MPPSQRAKQFAPFDALVGLRKALKDKEKIREPRKEVSDDMAAEINMKLVNLKVSDIITVVYYNELEQEYIQLTGKIVLLDEYKKTVQIEGTVINVDDIYEIII